MARNAIPPALRQYIYERDGFKCRYCGVDLSGDPIRLTIDHVIPRSRGGSNSEWNLVTCCRRDNRRKRDHLMTEVMMRIIPLPGEGPDVRYGHRLITHVEDDPFIVRDVLDVL